MVNSSELKTTYQELSVEKERRKSWFCQTWSTVSCFLKLPSWLPQRASGSILCRRGTVAFCVLTAPLSKAYSFPCISSIPFYWEPSVGSLSLYGFQNPGLRIISGLLLAMFSSTEGKKLMTLTKIPQKSWNALGLPPGPSDAAFIV